MADMFQVKECTGDRSSRQWNCIVYCGRCGNWCAPDYKARGPGLNTRDHVLINGRRTCAARMMRRRRLRCMFTHYKGHGKLESFVRRVYSEPALEQVRSLDFVDHAFDCVLGPDDYSTLRQHYLRVATLF